MNRVILFGNVGRDPEIRSISGGGGRVANIALATSERWKDRNSGEAKEKTEWHRVVAFGPVVDVIEKHVKKGSRLLIEGTLQTRKYVDQGGVEKYSTEIKLINFDFGGEAAARSNADDTRESPAPRKPSGRSTSTITDDEVPWA
jgi:single-strand DNA-binding protein